jgi:hypothetical protein
VSFADGWGPGAILASLFPAISCTTATVEHPGCVSLAWSKCFFLGDAQRVERILV